ncbi:MAG: hypothetical protein J5979_01120 [Lachnospiraceae bacterium]|nr:hypothetical protein [Lachnospiraceae bacterium]
MGLRKWIYPILGLMLGISLFLGGCRRREDRSSSDKTKTEVTVLPKQDVLQEKAATILTGEKVQIALRKEKIVQAVSSDNCVTVTDSGEVTAVEPGKSIVTVTDVNGYEYEFPVWVREKNGTLGGDVRVVIIGNSLMGQGHFMDGLEVAAEAYGQKLAVRDFSKDSYALKKHLAEMKRGKRPKLMRAVENADVLILQGMSSDNLSAVLKKYKEYCQPSTRIYFYETEFMNSYETKLFSGRWSDQLQKAQEQKEAEVIRVEEMLNATYDLGFAYEDYHVSNDYHPNVFNCQLAALMAYAQIFDEKCSDYSEAFIDQRLYSYLRGESEEEQAECFYHICDIIDQHLNSPQT